MSDVDMVEEYLQQFLLQLRFQGRQSQRVIAEIGDHLREAIDELCRQGMEPEEAAAMAIERFGTPAEVLRQFELEAPIESEVVAMIRILLTPIAGLSFLFAALFLVMSWFDDAPPAMLAMKIVTSLLVIGCSVVLLHRTWAARPWFRWERELALAAALLSVAIGSAASVFTAHLGLVTHDWEMYGFVVAGVVVLQGILAALQLLHDAPNPMNLSV